LRIQLRYADRRTTFGIEDLFKTRRRRSSAGCLVVLLAALVLVVVAGACLAEISSREAATESSLGLTPSLFYTSFDCGW